MPGQRPHTLRAGGLVVGARTPAAAPNDAAAALPLVLTMAGLLSAGGLLFVCAQLIDVSIWAINSATALGIDYALFIVARFRGALAAGLSATDATAFTMATAGKAWSPAGPWLSLHW